MYYIYKDKLSTINLFIILKKSYNNEYLCPLLKERKNGWTTGNRIEMKKKTTNKIIFLLQNLNRTINV